MSAALKPRAVLEQAIEALITVLDTLDPDPDLEDTGDQEDGEDTDLEPSLGGVGQYLDGRLAYDLEHDGSDDEPSLGRLETMNQGAASYAIGGVIDGEYDVATAPHDAEDGI